MVIAGRKGHDASLFCLSGGRIFFFYSKNLLFPYLKIVWRGVEWNFMYMTSTGEQTFRKKWNQSTRDGLSRSNIVNALDCECITMLYYKMFF